MSLSRGPGIYFLSETPFRDHPFILGGGSPKKHIGLSGPLGRRGAGSPQRPRFCSRKGPASVPLRSVANQLTARCALVPAARPATSGTRAPAPLLAYRHRAAAAPGAEPRRGGALSPWPGAVVTGSWSERPAGRPGARAGECQARGARCGTGVGSPLQRAPRPPPEAGWGPGRPRRLGSVRRGARSAAQRCAARGPEVTARGAASSGLCRARLTHPRLPIKAAAGSGARAHAPGLGSPGLAALSRTTDGAR